MEQNLVEDKPPNYRQDANFLSAATFWWTFKIFSLGYKRDLFETDLPEPLKEHTASMLGDKISRLWSKEYARAKLRQETPNLTKVLSKCFLSEYMIYGVALACVELILKPLQPLFVGLLVRYFTVENINNTNSEEFPMYFYRLFYYNYPNQSAIKRREAVLYTISIIVCSMISVTFQHPYMLAVMHLGMKVRVACMSLMYRKTLRMSMLALSPTTVGNVINLMSNDATRFDIITMYLHYLWISPLQMLLFMYILYWNVGVSAFIGCCAIIFIIPVQVFLAHWNKNLRWKTAFKTDERVRLMNEIISGIQVIKMYTWEYAFCKLIQATRRREMLELVKTSYIRGVIMSMILFTSRATIVLTFISFVLFYGNVITSEKVFIVVGYYVIMRSTMTVFFPQGIAQVAETLITIKRTRDYMMNEEATVGDPSVLNPSLKDAIAAKVTDEADSEMSILKNSPAITPGIRIIEAYARWTNKKHVLRDIEFSIKNGELVVLIGRVGAGKTSLLHVILKELPVCRGYISVKGTVSYASQEPWLFAGSVRQNILFGHTYNRDRYRKVCKVCALLKDFKLLPYGDQTVVGERGTSLSGGQRARINLARCIYKQADIYVMDDPLSALDPLVGSQIFEGCITKFLAGKIRVLVTHHMQFLQHVDQMVVMDKGRVLAKGTFNDLQTSGLNILQYITMKEEPVEQEDILSIHDMQRKSVSLSSRQEGLFYDPSYHHLEHFQESRGSGTIGLELYKQYFQAGGSVTCLILVIILFVITQGVASASDFFIGQWVKIEELEAYEGKVGFGIVTNMSGNECIIAYAVLTLLLIVFSIVRSHLFFYVCLRASLKLHDKMFDSVVFGHMRFFHMNSSGRILNRFSKDIGAIDEDLPFAMIDFIQMLLSLIGVVIVLSATNYYLVIPIIIAVTGMILLREYYLKTSRSLKRLEGVVRSAVFSHLNASIQGLSTVRSHEAEAVLTYEFDKHMDLHSSAWYLFIATARAFSVWMDWVCVMLIAFAIFAFLFLEFVFHLDIMAGDVGLIVTQCLSLMGLIPWGMRQSAEMENQMTSVERVIDFINIDHEPALKTSPEKKPPPDWPPFGEIEFIDLQLKYGPRDEPVLKHFSLVINAQEKVGIVGRTGAGKSSLISALFRLAFQSGAIIIDGIDIFTLGLHDVRKEIAIIPQEPVIFTGTIRFNLDPFRKYADETLLAALSIVDLESGTRNILSQSLVEGGSNFSAGQKQLLCLARAIVRNNRIIILDEATSNMDPETDRLIQQIIRNKFENCTVLTIAHRLHTIMDSDKVLVIHAGTVVEYDHPHLLLKKEDGFFTSMVNQTGKGTIEYLKNIAENAYLHNRRLSLNSTYSFEREEPNETK